MSKINRRAFVELYKELAKLYDNLESLSEYFEKDRDAWKRKYFKLLDRFNEIVETVQFCVNNMKNEYACTDSRTNRELHSMVEMLEDLVYGEKKDESKN